MREVFISQNIISRKADHVSLRDLGPSSKSVSGIARFIVHRVETQLRYAAANALFRKCRSNKLCFLILVSRCGVNVIFPSLECDTGHDSFLGVSI